MSQFGRFILSSQLNGDILTKSERESGENLVHISKLREYETVVQSNAARSRGDVGRLFYFKWHIEQFVYKTITKRSIKYILKLS